MHLAARILPVALFAAFLLPAVAAADDLQVIVGFHGEADPGVLARHGGAAENDVEELRAVAGRVPAGKLKALSAEPGVAYVEERLVRQTQNHNTPNDPYYNRPSSSFNQIDDFSKANFPAAWEVSTGSGVRVSVLDTGVQKEHVDIGYGPSGKVKAWKNFTTSGTSTDVSDKNGHGTHTAGTVGARTKNGVGVAAAGYNCELAIGKVLGQQGGYDDWIANGILWSVSESGGNAKIISMSLGGQGLSATLDSALNSAGATAVIVAAAGNSSMDAETFFPAAHPKVISVAATTNAGVLASFSNYGPSVDIAAPGVSITSTYKGNKIANLSGTSMACPHVAGAAALVWSKEPGASNATVRLRLESGATVPVTAHFNLLNAAASVNSTDVAP